MLIGARQAFMRSSPMWKSINGLYTKQTLYRCYLNVSRSLTAAADASIETIMPHLKDSTNRIMVGSILARPPIILRRLSEFESAYEEYREQLQKECSRGEFDIMTEHRRQLEELRESNTAESNKQAQMAEYQLEDEYAESDKDTSSLRRKLERKLYLVVKNERDLWGFPAIPAFDASIPLHQVSGNIRMLID